MVNANENKWEPVADERSLVHGDVIRASHEDGNVLTGTATGGPMNYKAARFIESAAYAVRVGALIHAGYRIERAVRERTLPTRPGVYVNPHELRTSVPSDVKFYARERGRWVTGGNYIDEAKLPDELAYVATATEVHQAEQRAHRAEKRLKNLRACIEIVGKSGDFEHYPGLRQRVLELVDDETSHV